MVRGPGNRFPHQPRRVRVAKTPAETSAVSIEHTAVVIVGDHDDPHWAAVGAFLDTGGVPHLRFNLSNLRSVPQIARTGTLDLLVNGTWRRVDRNTTVWWRRLGSVDLVGLDHAEARFVLDEVPHLLRGAFFGAGVRWVDDPFLVARAETKQLQLAVAAGLGVRLPRTVVTNDISTAKAFADDRSIVAKSVSAGQGIAPYVATVRYDDLNKVSAVPTLLQELVRTRADLRVVVVNR